MATKHLISGRWHWGPSFAGYKVYVYEPGTSTAKATYSDSALTVANTDPVVLDANGAAQIWFAGNAKIIVYTAGGSLYQTDDNVNPTETQTQTGVYNLIVNGSFEDDTNSDGIPDGWTRTLYTGGAFVVDTATQFNGQKSIKFISTGTGGGYFDSTDQFAVQPSKAYDVIFGIRSSVADVRNVVQVFWYKADGTASATASSTVYDESAANPTSWTSKIGRVSSPSDAYFAKLRLIGCHNSDATSGSVWFDDVVMTDAVTLADTQTIPGAKTFSNTLTMSGAAINGAKGADIASAATTNIGAATGNLVDVTGTTTITALGTVQAGTRRTVRFTGALILTHNATSLILPGGVNITTVANDVAEFMSLGSGNWMCTKYQRGSGYSGGTQVFTASGSWTAPAGVTSAKVLLISGGGGGGGGVSNAGRGGGGGGAGGSYLTQHTVVPGTSYTVTIGAAGTAGAANGGAGGNGGATEFDAISVSGGIGGGATGGTSFNSSTAGAAGSGTATAGTQGGGVLGAGGQPGAGGGAGGGGGGAGGSSIFGKGGDGGAGGAGGIGGGAGTAGTYYGGGGGGGGGGGDTSAGAAGGAGTAGLVVVWW